MILHGWNLTHPSLDSWKCDHHLCQTSLQVNLEAALGPPSNATVENVVSGAATLDLYIQSTKFTLDDSICFYLTATH
ncbi:UNVERIFIED_CONTAM: hypothetical protein HDU68_009283, partial [Siphonaria sp. JEL0065]